MKNNSQKLYVGIILAVAVIAIILILFKAPSSNFAGQVISTACSPPPSGLVSWWPGDGNANDLRGGNTGAIQGGVSYTAGKVDQGFAFDGTSSVVTVGSQSAFRQSSAMTYSFWVKIPSGGGGHIMGTGSRGGQGFGGLYLNQNVLYFYWTPSNPGLDTSITASGFHIPADEWTHVAVAIDFTNRQQSIYINGQKLYDDITISRSSTNWLPLSQYNFAGTDAFGGRFVNNWLYFRGSLDEISVFNRFLSDQEIYSITNAGSAGMCKGVISAPVCGNGFIESGEVCDDGNTLSTDSCTAQCQPASCGDGIIQGGIQNEQCDDGNRIATDACTDTCFPSRCGDGIVQAGVETCDDGNGIETDGCTSQCQTTRCGDGVVQIVTGEQCDDGNTVNDGDGCTNNCRSQTRLPLGSHCLQDGVCASRRCSTVTWRCSEERGLNQPCGGQADVYCAANLVCRHASYNGEGVGSGSRACRARLTLNQNCENGVCESNLGCGRGSYYRGRAYVEHRGSLSCRARLPQGASCEASDDICVAGLVCSSGASTQAFTFCNPSTSLLRNGETCTESSQCLSNICIHYHEANPTEMVCCRRNPPASIMDCSQ